MNMHTNEDGQVDSGASDNSGSTNHLPNEQQNRTTLADFYPRNKTRQSKIVGEFQYKEDFLNPSTVNKMPRQARRANNQHITSNANHIQNSSQGSSNPTGEIQISNIKIGCFAIIWTMQCISYTIAELWGLFALTFGFGIIYIVSNYYYYHSITIHKIHKCYVWVLFMQEHSTNRCLSIFLGIVIGCLIIPFGFFGIISYCIVSWKTKRFPHRVPIDLKCRRTDCKDICDCLRQACKCLCCFPRPPESSNKIQNRSISFTKQ